jgi:glycosyltransferase involved in cell wall biosynthesis
MDSYPETLVQAGRLRAHGLPQRALSALNRWIFRKLDHLICLDEAMRRHVLQAYAPATGLASSVIPNWEPADRFPIDDLPTLWKPLRPIRDSSKTVVLYIGNAGVGHRFETVLAAVPLLLETGVSFVFVGGGVLWEEIQRIKMQRGYTNLHLFRYAPEERLPSILASADVALITLRDEFLGVISPSKLHSYLAMSLPVLYVGPRGGNVDEAIRRFDCGVSLRHGQTDALVEFVQTATTDPERWHVLQHNARLAFNEAYSADQTLPMFDPILQGVASSAPPNHS